MASHEINRLRIKLDGTISEAAKQRIELVVRAALEDSFERHFPADRDFEIKSIELDLGTLTYDKLFQQLNDRIRLLLNREFARLEPRILAALPEGDSESTEQSKDIGSLFLEYLQKGTTGKKDVELADLFARMLERQPAQLDRMLTAVRQSPKMRRRLFHQLPFELLESYWKQFFPSWFRKVSKTHGEWLQALQSSGINERQLEAVRKFLQRSAFGFFTDGESLRNLEEYEAYIGTQWMNQSDKRVADVYVLKRVLPVHLTKTRDDNRPWFALLRLIQSGGFASEAVALVPTLHEHQVAELAKTMEPDSPRRSERLRGIFGLLNARQLSWFLAALRRMPMFQEHIAAVSFLDGFLRRTLAVELLDQSRFLVADFLSGPADQQRVADLYSAVVARLAITTRQSRSELVDVANRALASSRYEAARHLRQVFNQAQLSVQITGSSEKEAVDALMVFFVSGQWRFSNAPTDVLLELYGSKPQRLVSLWKKVEDMPLAWIGLLSLGISQEWLKKFFESVYSTGSSVSAVLSMVRGKPEREAREIWYTYARVRALIKTGEDDERKQLFRQLLATAGKTSRRQVAADVSLPRPELTPDAVEGWVYVKAFIHWMKYGTFILQELESDGTVVALARMQRYWSSIWNEQIRKDPEWQNLLQRFFIMVTPEEHRAWFRIMAPRLESKWEQWKHISLATGTRNTEWLPLAVALEWRGFSEAADDVRLDRIFHVLGASESVEFTPSRELFLQLLEGGPESISVSQPALERVEQRYLGGIPDVESLGESLPEEWLRLGIAPGFFPEHTFPQLLAEVIRTGAFPGWSTVYSAHGLEKILYAGSPPVVHRILLGHFRAGADAEVFLRLAGIEKYLSWLEVADRALYGALLEPVNTLVPALRFLGDETGMRKFLWHQFLVRFYRSPDLKAAVQSTLAEIPMLFGVREEDVQTQWLNFQEQVVWIRDFFAIRSIQRPAVPKVPEQQQLDLLIHALNYNRKPWWWEGELDRPALIRSLISSNPVVLIRALEVRVQAREWLSVIHRDIGEQEFLEWIERLVPGSGPIIRSILSLMEKWRPGFNRIALEVFLLVRFREYAPSDQQTLFKSFIEYLTDLYRLGEQDLLQEWSTLPKEIVQLPILASHVKKRMEEAGGSAEPSIELTDVGDLTGIFLKDLVVPVGMGMADEQSVVRAISLYFREQAAEARQRVERLLRQALIRQRFVRLAPQRIRDLVFSFLAGSRTEVLMHYADLLRAWIYAKSGQEAASQWTQVFYDRILWLLIENQAASAEDQMGDTWQGWLKASGTVGLMSGVGLQDSGLPTPLVEALNRSISKANQERFPGTTKSVEEGNEANTSGATLLGSGTIESGKKDFKQDSFEAGNAQSEVDWSEVGSKIFGNDWPELLFRYRQLSEILGGSETPVSRPLLDRIFSRQVLHVSNAGKQVRLILAELVATVIRQYAMDETGLVHVLKASGYPSAWADALIQDAGLQPAERQATPVEAVAVRVAYYNASFTLLHYLQAGEWPEHVDKSGMDLPSFLTKLDRQAGVDVEQVRRDVRQGLRDTALRLRLSLQKSFAEQRSLVAFLFPESRTGLLTFSDWLIPVLAKSINQSEDEVSSWFYQALFELSVDGSSRYRSEDAWREMILEKLAVRVRKGFRIPQQAVASGNLSPALIRKMAQRGWTEDVSEIVSNRRLSDLLLHMVLRHEVPWWAMNRTENLRMSDSEIRRVASLVMRTEPEELLERIAGFSPPSRGYLPLLPFVEGELFIRLVAAVHLGRTANWVRWMDHGMEKAGLKIDQIAWRSFIMEQMMLRPSTSVLYTRALEFLADAGDFSAEVLVSIFLKVIGESTESVELDWVRFLEDRNISRATIDSEIPSIDFIGLLEHYLNFGSIPAGRFDGISGYDDFHRILQEQIGLGNPRVRSLILESLRSISVRDRLVRSAPESMMNLMVRILFPHAFRELEGQRGIWFRFFRDQSRAVSSERFNRSWYQALLINFSARGPVTDSLEKIIVQVFRQLRQSLSYQQQVGSEVLRRYGVPDPVLQELIRSDVGVRKPEERPLDPSDDGISDQDMEISNAGLVIVWPFLSRYFDMLGLMEKGAFKSEDDAARAVLLLQYVATGTASAPEHELALNKVLCGLPFSTPVPLAIEPTAREEEVTTQMLRGVLQNWEKLKNSSVDALREGFLIRDGYLRETEQTWELRVEKKTLDILMDSMPWSFGTIKMSWMKKRMIVKWR